MKDSEKSTSTGKMTWGQRFKSLIPFRTGDPEDFLGEGLAKQVGNVTECALLGFLSELGQCHFSLLDSEFLC